MLFRKFLLLTLLFLPLFSAEAAENAPLSLKHGLNTAGWLANARRHTLSDHDFRRIAAAGFDHIRLPINPEFFGLSMQKGTPDTLNFAPLDQAITLALKNNLTVVLDIHFSKATQKTLEDKDWAEEKLLNLWKSLAAHYDEKHYPTGKLVFELFNEPQYYRSEARYYALTEKLIAAIRQQNPDRTIIVGAPNGSSIKGLTKMKPFKDPNLIYAFHFYEPYIITHQGLRYGFEKTTIRDFENLPYPSSLATQPIDTYAPNTSKKSLAEENLKDYVGANWNAERIKERIAEAKTWADENKVQIICGEFGIMKAHIDPSSRYRWIADTRKALEENNIGWEYWEYTDLMGIVKLIGKTSQPDPVDESIHLIDANGRREFEPEALQALGLK